MYLKIRCTYLQLNFKLITRMKIDPGKLGFKGGPEDRAIREIPGTQSTGIPRCDLVSYVFT